MSEKYFLATGSNEWLLTNGIGGYALGTGNLINQRKYHGLLISSDINGNRNSLLSGLEIMIEWRGGTFHIDSTNYSNCIYPEGFLHLVKSWLRPYPAFLYSSLHHNNDILVMMELMMADKENTVLVKFRNLGHHQLHFHIRPKLTLRNHHHTNASGCWENEPFNLRCNQNSFTVNKVNTGLLLHGMVKNGSLIEDRIIFHDCYYPWEAIRGYYGVEDLIAPVKISFDLQVGHSNHLFFTDKEDGYCDAEAIQAKYSHLPVPKDFPLTHCLPNIEKHDVEDCSYLEQLDYDNKPIFDNEQYLKILVFSLEDFIIQDDIIAGYPWFGCWGRDTFITLGTLIDLLSFGLPDKPQKRLENPDTTKKIRLICNIFDKYGSLIKDGLLPNMLPESGQEGNYDSCDSCLWFVVRLKEFIDTLVALGGGNLKDHMSLFAERALGYANLILSGIINNRTYPFHIAEDGLLCLEEEFAAATWMDAKVNGKAVTPRTGAPVEINALFYNALCSFRDLQKFAEKEGIDCSGFMAEPLLTKYLQPVAQSFPKFFFDDYLADRLDNGELIKEYRPNALIALSLPYPLLPEAKMQLIVETAKKELLTGYGLRTLSPSDYRFKKKYLGNQTDRDNQYHQGTVWAFILGFYSRSYYNAYRHSKDGRITGTGHRTVQERIKEELTAVSSTLRNDYLNGHISSVAEVWDGYIQRVPKGCPAQAWSVAALLNIEILINRL